MRAAIMRDSQLVIDQMDSPSPESGEVLVKTLACGICGSDLHALQHGREFAETAREAGGPFTLDLTRDLVMGHEFCAELLDYGPGCSKRLPVGSRVCAMPMLFRNSSVTTVGYSNEVPGGYAERMLLAEPLLLEVPNGLTTERAALTEPMAVGQHAVEMAHIQQDDVPLVIGCGPVGLAVISALKAKGVGPVMAADFSEARRKLAETMGADLVLDPAETSPYASWQEASEMTRSGQLMPMEPLTASRTTRPGVIFECVGVPGVIDQIMCGALRGTRILVVGVCMKQDIIRPLLGINKELNLQFVLGYTEEEFARTLFRIAEGSLDVSPLITDKVGLSGVVPAFTALARPEDQVKILIEPWRD